MNQTTKLICLSFTKLDTYLDLSYYKIETTYWDKDKELNPNQVVLKLGDYLNLLFDKFDNYGTDIQVDFKFKNDILNQELLKKASGQVESKQGKLSSCRVLCSTEKESRKLRDNLQIYNCLVR